MSEQSSNSYGTFSSCLQSELGFTHSGPYKASPMRQGCRGQFILGSGPASQKTTVSLSTWSLYTQGSGLRHGSKPQQSLESSPISSSVCVCAHVHVQYVCARAQCVHVCVVCLRACAVCVCTHAHAQCVCVRAVCVCMRA